MVSLQSLTGKHHRKFLECLLSRDQEDMRGYEMKPQKITTKLQHGLARTNHDKSSTLPFSNTCTQYFSFFISAYVQENNRYKQYRIKQAVSDTVKKHV